MYAETKTYQLAAIWLICQSIGSSSWAPASLPWVQTIEIARFIWKTKREWTFL